MIADLNADRITCYGVTCGIDGKSCSTRIFPTQSQAVLKPADRVVVANGYGKRIIRAEMVHANTICINCFWMARGNFVVTYCSRTLKRNTCKQITVKSITSYDDGGIHCSGIHINTFSPAVRATAS